MHEVREDDNLRSTGGNAAFPLEICMSSSENNINIRTHLIAGPPVKVE